CCLLPFPKAVSPLQWRRRRLVVHTTGVNGRAEARAPTPHRAISSPGHRIRRRSLPADDESYPSYLYIPTPLKRNLEAVALFKSYFGGTFDQDAIRNNLVLIYKLLDEIMDFGYPQNLSPKFLKLYITQERVRSPFSSKPSDKPVLNATLQVIGVVGWRRDGIVYKKNEGQTFDFGT
uniref:Uncharacterized protein n=1 Tax=Triticum urartu TaxID=4572 RepID=A0A8R7PLM4_TRIUA